MEQKKPVWQIILVIILGIGVGIAAVVYFVERERRTVRIELRN